MPKFRPGQSGNPKGKKPGTLNKRTELVKLLEPYATSLINKTVELALNGDINALRLCIERLVPKAKEHSIQVVIPDTKGKTVKEVLKEILASLHGQQITISELKSIIALVHDDDNEFSESERLELHNFINDLVKKHQREY